MEINYNLGKKKFTEISKTFSNFSFEIKKVWTLCKMVTIYWKKNKAGFAIKWRRRLIGFLVSADNKKRTDEQCHNTDIEKTTLNDSACLLGESLHKRVGKKCDRHAWKTILKKAKKMGKKKTYWFNYISLWYERTRLGSKNKEWPPPQSF